MVTPTGRWMNYVLQGGAKFVPFWESLLQSSNRDILFVIGRGFDPRMCEAVKRLSSLGGTGKRDCVVVEFDEGETSPSHLHDELIARNMSALEKLFLGKGTISVKQVKMLSEDGRRRIGSRGAAAIFLSPNDFVNYSDILVDISALPRSLYIPLLAKLLHLIDGLGQTQSPNLHVIATDDPVLDQVITAEGLNDDAAYIHGFESGIESEATADFPKVWMPILGESKLGHFDRIYNLVAPDEIAPIVPFPCKNPRRSDNLILEYRRHIFDTHRIEPSNFIYVPEQNPFGVYREIRSAVQHYSNSLQTLGGCKVVLSALSSKLLSLGALLAAYELKRAGHAVGIAHVHALGYNMSNPPSRAKNGEMFEVWVTGEPYQEA